MKIDSHGSKVWDSSVCAILDLIKMTSILQQIKTWKVMDQSMSDKNGESSFQKAWALEIQLLKLQYGYKIMNSFSANIIQRSWIQE